MSNFIPNITEFNRRKSNFETLFSSETKYETRKNLNRKDEVYIEENLIRPVVDTGVTSEWIDELSAKYDVDILKYKTQITIHANFEKLFNLYQGYAKNLIVYNKNKTLGIKYNGIDECKRIELAKALQIIGISYHRNSTESFFYKTIILDDDVEKFKELTDLFIKVKELEHLFLGKVNIYKVTFYGVTYVLFKLVVNVIKQENVESFYMHLGVTNEAIKQAEIDKQIIIDKRREMNELSDQNKVIAEYIVKDKMSQFLLEDLVLDTGKCDKLNNELKFIQGGLRAEYGAYNTFEPTKYEPVYDAYIFRKLEGERRYSFIIKEFECLETAVKFIINLKEDDKINLFKANIYAEKLNRMRTFKRVACFN